MHPHQALPIPTKEDHTVSIVTVTTVPAASPHRPALGAASALETVLVAAAARSLPEIWAWRIGTQIGRRTLFVAGQLATGFRSDVEAWAAALGGEIVAGPGARLSAVARVSGVVVEIWTTTESEATR